MMGNEQNDYLQLIGQQVLQQQLAQQQQATRPMDTTTAQNLRNWQIASERNQRELERTIAKAKERAAAEIERKARANETDRDRLAEAEKAVFLEKLTERYLARGLPRAGLSEYLRGAWERELENRMSEEDFEQLKKKYLPDYSIIS